MLPGRRFHTHAFKCQEGTRQQKLTPVCRSLRKLDSWSVWVRRRHGVGVLQTQTRVFAPETGRVQQSRTFLT